jgi:two-component system phosphate regulon response regulator PhoB
MPKKPKKIIVVDDDKAITEALQLALTAFNFVVKTVTKVSDFEPLYKRFKPDLVIIDYFLAGEAGTKIAHDLIQEKKDANVKVVMFSAHPSAKDDIGDLKIDAFVAKPFDINSLVRKINNLLQ